MWGRGRLGEEGGNAWSYGRAGSEAAWWEKGPWTHSDGDHPTLLSPSFTVCALSVELLAQGSCLRVSHVLGFAD